MVKWNKPGRKRPEVGDPGYEEWADTVRFHLNEQGKWPPKEGEPYYDILLYFDKRAELGLREKRERTRTDSENVDMDKETPSETKRTKTNEEENDDRLNEIAALNNRTRPPSTTPPKTPKPKPTIEGQGTLDGFIGTGM